MRPRVDEASLVKHRDQIGRADRGQPVRNHDRRAVAHQVVERPPDERLVERVQVRRGLIEDQHRRVLEERPGDRHPLTLAAG